MKLVAISDIHNQLSKVLLPPGDLLCIAGDLTGRGTIPEVAKFNYDLGQIKHLYRHIVCIAGNHDFLAEENPNLFRSMISNVDFYLKDSGVEIEGIKFWGSPHQPEFGGWAFNVERGPDIKAIWNKIPLDIDVVITHGPCYNILDETPYGEHVGDEDLLDTILKIKPKIHLAGHLHSGYGIKDFNGTTFVNASICNEKYLPINKPIEIEI